MSKNGTDHGFEEAQLEAKKVQMFEVIVRWVPETGQLQVGSSQVDPVIQYGMLEMAKQALTEQRQAVASGKGPSLIVPGRFN